MAAVRQKIYLAPCAVLPGQLGRHTGRQRGHPCSTTAEPARPATSFPGACLYAPARARPYRRSGPEPSDQRLQNSGGHIGRRRSEDVHAAPARQIHHNSWRRWQRVAACLVKHDGFDEADLRRRRSVLHFSFAAPSVDQCRRHIILPGYLYHAGTGRECLRQNLRPLVLTPASTTLRPAENRDLTHKTAPTTTLMRQLKSGLSRPGKGDSQRRRTSEPKLDPVRIQPNY